MFLGNNLLVNAWDFLGGWDIWIQMQTWTKQSKYFNSSG